MALGGLQACRQGINLPLQLRHATVGLLLALARGNGHDTVPAGLGASFTRAIGMAEIGLASDFELTACFAGARTSQFGIRIVWIDGVELRGCAGHRARFRPASVYRWRRLGVRGAAVIAGPTCRRDGGSQLVSGRVRGRWFGVIAAACKSGGTGGIGVGMSGRDRGRDILTTGCGAVGRRAVTASTQTRIDLHRFAGTGFKARQPGLHDGWMMVAMANGEQYHDRQGFPVAWPHARVNPRRDSKETEMNIKLTFFNLREKKMRGGGKARRQTRLGGCSWAKVGEPDGR